jgi:hypothetical protein
MTRKAMLETMARAMCEADGVDPEVYHWRREPVRVGGPMGGFILRQEEVEDAGRAWMSYLPLAEAALRSLGPAMSRMMTELA